MSARLKRREFITLLGGAAAMWPVAARTQQNTIRTIGWFSLRSADTDSEKSILTAFRQGLSQTGHVEGRNLTIEFGFADGQYDRLPGLAADLVRRRVEVLVTAGGTNIIAWRKPRPQRSRSSLRPPMIRSRTASSKVSIGRVATAPERLCSIPPCCRSGSNCCASSYRMRAWSASW